MRSVLALALGAKLVLAQSTTSVTATRPTASLIEPSLSQIIATQATAPALSPVSNVKGAGFDRFVQIWLENTDYAKAAADPNFQWLATQGITLTNYNAVTHPSQPNYAAVVAGDIFGMDNDDFIAVGNNISTVVDLLDTKGISWGEYQEDQPYAGFQGFNYSNQVTYANDYVRKHNPLIRFGSVNTNDTRLALLKNFTSFESDLAAQTLPQWMFVTPNMTNDGHDTTVTVAGAWSRSWLAPLLNNSYFMNNTLILLTFDETETYTTRNFVYSILLGGAVPTSLHNTTDDTFYNHYSAISSVSVNWGLPSLGRWDCQANVFQTVANVTKYDNYVVNTTNLFFNQSYPGPLSDALYSDFWPLPDTTAKCASGQGVLASIASTWGNSNGTYNYTNVYPYDNAADNNVGGTATLESPTASSTTNPTGTGSSSSSTSTSAAVGVQVGTSGLMAMVGAVLPSCDKSALDF